MNKSEKLFVIIFGAWLALMSLLILATDKANASPRWNYTYATWYGPGFYGNGVACGGFTYTQRMRGVAHPTLPCGTRLTIRCNQPRLCGKTAVQVKVVDRSGGAFDLTARTALDLTCNRGPYSMKVKWSRGWVYGSTLRLPKCVRRMR